MVMRKDITIEMRDKAYEVADQMDFSEMDAQALLDAAMSGFRHLAYFKHEIFDWASKVVDQPPISENPYLVERCLDTAWSAVPIVVFYLAVTIAAAREIELRSKRNKTNYYFGLLKLGHHLGIIEYQQKAWKELQRILSAIAYKSGWFHPDGWLDVVNLAVPQLLNEYASLDASATLKAMAENRFASVYQRIRARFIDEIRRLKHKLKEIALGDVPVSRSVADENLQRLAVIKLVGQVASGYGENDAPREILKKAEALLQNPAEIADYPREIRAEFVRDVAQNRGVSERQAQRDLREFEELINADETLQSLRDEIRALGQMRIVIREVQRAPEVTEDE